MLETILLKHQHFRVAQKHLLDQPPASSLVASGICCDGEDCQDSVPREFIQPARLSILRWAARNDCSCLAHPGVLSAHIAQRLQRQRLHVLNGIEVKRAIGASVGQAWNAQ